jgi:spore germination protein YaaH
VRRSRQRVLFFAGLAAFAVLLVVVLIFTKGPLSRGLERPGNDPLGYIREPLGGRKYRVCAWTIGDGGSLRAAIAARAVDEVDFDWYHSQANGSVRAQHEDLKQVAEAADADLNVFATVVNSPRYGDAFSREVAAAILATRSTRRRHIQALVSLVKDKGYDGIDLDWEELTAADRDKFSLFVEELAAALHAEERFLSIAVYPKTSEPGRWPSQQAMDYKRLGAVVDEFKLMTYAYSGPWSGPGPQSPYTWLDQVLTFAESRVPARKIYMGLPFFGYSWRGGGARAMTGREVARLPKRFLNGSERDDASGELILRFTDDYGVAHHAYVPDATAVAKKLAFLRREHPRIGGIAIWVMGQEGKGFWSAVADGLQKP